VYLVLLYFIFYRCDVCIHGAKSEKNCCTLSCCIFHVIDTMYTTMGLHLTKLVYLVLYCLFYWYDVYNNGTKSDKTLVPCLVFYILLIWCMQQWDYIWQNYCTLSCCILYFIDTMYAAMRLHLTKLLYLVLLYFIFYWYDVCNNGTKSDTTIVSCLVVIDIVLIRCMQQWD
jgi:hypothetical protein